MCFLREGKKVIFPLEIDVGLQFPYYPDLVEIYFHYCISYTQLSPNVIHTWVDFRVWCHTLLILFLAFTISTPIVSMFFFYK